MAKKITIEEVKRIANLANINLTEEEAIKFAPQIDSILEYVEKLNEIMLDVEEFKSQTDLKNVFREDKPRKKERTKNMTRNRETINGSIVISSVIPS